MKHAAHEISKPRTFLERGLWLVVLGFALCVPALAEERLPRERATPQTPTGRVAVPRGSVDSTPPGSAQRQPSARDTRQIPPGQYRHPSPPGGGRPPGHGGYHYRGYYPRYPYSSWGWWGGWSWWWGPYGYGAPYWWAYPAPAYRIHYVATDLGGLDLNVKPKKAAVYVDGQYVGMAKDFDGYPGYLWLEKGRYELSLAMPGYRTFSDDFEIRPGQVIEVRLRLAPGAAALPGESSASEPEQRAPATEPAPFAAEAPVEMETEREQVPHRAEEEVEAPGQTGRLHFLVRPSDASVYLDGRLLGSGSELARLHAGMIVEAGRHRLEIVRPGFLAQELQVFVEADGELDLKVELQKDSG